ncbi:MAG: DsbE family thiol:disulfide interchange protein [Betaproteobacteria bacterium]|nr:MAG: DsbE family thiol:disulfide interchange protein [Betaproteobacteria bacterium]
MSGKALRFLLPLAIFLGIVFFLWRGLALNPREVPSPLIDKKVPAFSVPLLSDASKTLSDAELRGKVYLLNVWGSWCVSCREEHPVLVELAKKGTIPIYGLNWKDKQTDAIAWLARYGDPYVASGVDRDGRVAIDFGVYGAPETYLIDRDGVIRFKQTGPLTWQIIEQRIMPLVAKM